MSMVDETPREKRPLAGCWKRFTHVLLDRTPPGAAASVWINGALRVISTLIVADYPDGQGAGPQWHLSVSIAGLRRRVRKHEVKQLLRDFDMEGAEEDNHHPGVARHFWIPLDPVHRVDCQCKADEATIVEPDRYAWTNPKSATPANCRGCEFCTMTGRRCPIHHQGGVMETEQKKTAAELIVELRALLDTEAESTVVDADRRDQILQQLAEALQHVPSCALKMKPGEPGFTLRGQDVTADLATALWAHLNGRIAFLMDMNGLTLEAARTTVEHELSAFMGLTYSITPKIEGALNTAAEMSRWPTRKLAD